MNFVPKYINAIEFINIMYNYTIPTQVRCSNTFTGQVHSTYINVYFIIFLFYFMYLLLITVNDERSKIKMLDKKPLLEIWEMLFKTILKIYL